jgi:hypothetical protein
MVSKRSSLKRWAPAFCLALIASLALSGLATGSASATTQRWYSCSNVGAEKGVYTDSACQTVGKGSYDWNALTSTPTGFGLKGTTPYTITGVIAGLNEIVTCSNAQASGSLANPAGEKAGTLSTTGETSLSLTGCSIALKSNGKTCSIESGAIPFKALSGEATELGGSPAVKVQPAEGTTLATFKVEPGECGIKTVFNVSLTGSFTAVANAASSSLEVTEAGSKSTFKANGSAAVFNGTARIETAAGEGLRVGIAAPVNTALPTVSPTNPNVGTVVTAANGTWVHSPTSYTYQWKRCSIAGTECKNLTGATKSTYTAGQLDEGHPLVVQVTAINAGGSTPASSAPTAVVNADPTGVHHWYVCEHVGVGGGFYEDAGCQESGGLGEYEWVQLKAGSPLSFTSTNLAPIELRYTLAKTTYTISCTTESGSGTVLNPTGGGAGTLTGSSGLLALSGCSYTEPIGTKCTVNGGSISSTAITGNTTEQNIALTSTEGGNLFQLTMTSCSPETMAISGTLNGRVNSVSSSLEFSGATSGKELKNGGAPTAIDGSIQLKTAKGLLRFKP